MFTPWTNEQNNINNDSIQPINQTPEDLITQSTISTPINPFTEFRNLQNQPIVDSPNITLAKFFAQKGNQPLSEIELEGVKALLSKNSPDTTTTTIKKEEQEDEEDDDNDDSELTNTNISINESLLQNNSKRIHSATPSFKATYNNKTTYLDVNSRSTSPDSIISRKKIYDFSGFPSPYRTSRLKSSFSINDLKKEVEQENKGKIEEEELKQDTKQLSNTASALLSFIENDSTSSNKDKNESSINKKDNKFIDFSNPYAINRKPKRSIQLKKSEQSASERLEESLKEEEQKQISINSNQQSQSQQQLQQPTIPQQQVQFQQSDSLNKYKPVKSSSLRESITIFDEDQSMDSTITSNSTNITKDLEINSPISLTHQPIVESTPALNNSKPFTFQKPASGFFPSITSTSTSTSTSNTESNTENKDFNKTQLFSNDLDSPPQTSLFQLKPKDNKDLDIQMIDDDVSLFKFPDAIRSTLSINDIDEKKVRQYESLFTF